MKVSHQWDIPMVIMIYAIALFGINRIFNLWEREQYSQKSFIVVYIGYIVLWCFLIFLFANAIGRNNYLWG